MGRMDRAAVPGPGRVENPDVELRELLRRAHGEGQVRTSSARRDPAAGPPPQSPRDTSILRRQLRVRPPRALLWLLAGLRGLPGKLLGLVPGRLKRSKGARLVRRYPGLSAWLLMFAAVGLAIGGPSFTTPRLEDEPLRYQRWLERRGTSAVQATLARIGSHVDIDAVRARPREPWIGGVYFLRENAIEFNSEMEYDETRLLKIAAHECVHAIINQHSFQPYSATHGDYYSLVNETAAYVLGAHIAGDVWRRRGHDGHALTGTLIFLHRDTCDPAIPDSLYNRFLAPGRPQSGDFAREFWHGMLIHFAPVELVDAVDEICCRHTDPTDAARAICERFMRPDPPDPRDRRILEEFERRQARWPKGD